MPKKAKTTNTRRLAGSIVEPGRIELPTSCLQSETRRHANVRRGPTCTISQRNFVEPSPQLFVGIRWRWLPVWLLLSTDPRYR